MLESVIERAFVKAIYKVGGEAYKLNSLSINGLPDRLVLLPGGRALFVELKAPGEKMRPLQQKRAKQLQEMGFVVLCIDRLEQIPSAVESMLAWKPGEGDTL